MRKCTWVPCRPGLPAAGPRIRVVTYNILGDGPKLALGAKHDYCDLAVALRQWEHRRGRLLDEVDAYAADVYCFQPLNYIAFIMDY